eukprot:2061946-Pyramimonas_sp.AAC.1
MFNRWTTDRRAQTLRGREGPRVFGCRATARDSIEHSFQCPAWVGWQRGRLGQQLSRRGMARGMLSVNVDDAALRRQGISAHVFHRAVNA